MKYRKKPVVIEAIRWNDPFEDHYVDNRQQIIGWSDGLIWYNPDGYGTLVIPTLEGNMSARRGDYIIKGVQGEFYPCKPDIFEATYELVE